MKKAAQAKTVELKGPATVIENALNAFSNAPPERSISAMEVVVSYAVQVGRTVHPRPAREYVYHLTRSFNAEDGHIGQHWDDKILNAYAVRDEFLKIKNWDEALDFLCRTGAFSPLGHPVTWAWFQRWQRFAYLVQEHDGLAAMMHKHNWSGEEGEALKALTGIYPTLFFDVPEPPEMESDARWNEYPEFVQAVRESEASQKRKLSELCTWFRTPPTAIQWFPKNPKRNRHLLQEMQRGGAMLEYMLPQCELQPVLLISAPTTLQAIAAAIYGDRIQGVEYRTCEMCKRLFRLGAHREKKYCDRELCKNRAHQRNRRAKEKKEKRKGMASAGITKKRRDK